MKMDRNQSEIYAGNIFPKPRKAENTANVSKICAVKSRKQNIKMTLL